MTTPVETIKNRLSIEEVVGSYIKLERAGANYRSRCPFHNEKTPSFFVSPTRGGYYCFGCGAKGDIFTFVESFEGLDFKGALKVLADKAGVELKPERPGVKDEREKLFAIMESATRYFESSLKEHNDIKKYIHDRGVTDETIASFRIGFAPLGWRNLTEHLVSLGYSLAELEEAGLAKRSFEEGKNDKRPYDRFRGRVMFPISDSSGRIIAFSGRIVADDGASAKYLNSPETPLFDKSSTLYGLDKAKETIRRLGYAILVEGQFDLVLAHQVGTKNVVAASGTALADDDGETGSRGIANMKMLARLAKNVVLSFDGDSAGIRATYRGVRLAYRLGMDVKIAVLPEAKDPADIIREGVEQWQQVLKRTVPAISFFSSYLRSVAGSDERQYLKRMRDEVLPILLSLPSAIDQEYGLKLLEQETGVAADSWKRDLVLIEANSEYVQKTPSQPASNKKEAFFTRASDRLFGLIAWQRNLSKSVFDVDSVEKKLREYISDELFERLRDAASDKLDALIFQAEAAFEDTQSIAAEADMLVRLVTEESIKDELRTLSLLVRKAEINNDPELSKLLEKHRTLTQKFERLRTTGT